MSVGSVAPFAYKRKPLPLLGGEGGDEGTKRLDKRAVGAIWSAYMSQPSPPNRVRVQRRQRGWSQTELARRSGIPQSYISRYERIDEAFPRPDNIDKLAQAFDVAPDEVFRWLREKAS